MEVNKEKERKRKEKREGKKGKRTKGEKGRWDKETAMKGVEAVAMTANPASGKEGMCDGGQCAGRAHRVRRTSCR